MPRAEVRNQTRTALLEAGLYLFGHKGFEGTSTRELAARANTNIGSIAYHFGGKAGLRIACARLVADRVSKAFEVPDEAPKITCPDAALHSIEAMLTAFVKLIVAAPHAQDMVAFMLRELTDPSDIADTIYTEFLEPRHTILCALWTTAVGHSAKDDDVKLAVFTMIGQVLYLRIAKPFVARRMGWQEIGTAQTETILGSVITNLHAIIERQRR